MNMEKDGLYNGNLETDREVLLFCFLPVINNYVEEKACSAVISWTSRKT